MCGSAQCGVRVFTSFSYTTPEMLNKFMRHTVFVTIFGNFVCTYFVVKTFPILKFYKAKSLKQKVRPKLAKTLVLYDCFS